MKSVFVHKNVLLRDSHIAPDDHAEGWRLEPATIEAMRLLATEETLVFLYGAATSAEKTTDEESADHVMHELVRQIEAGGGRVDGLLLCPHGEGIECHCWGELPGLVWVPAYELNFHPEDCYLVGDAEQDVVTAYAASARPVVVLGERSIGSILGELPRHKDFPIAPDLPTAANYIAQEEEMRQRLGTPRATPRPLPTPEVLYAQPATLPRVTILSRLARSRQTETIKSRVQLRDVGRWLSFFSLGAVGLSLGIAYLLTHLYRIQPFPAFAYYLTLQFIPRPLRGALFILWGGIVVVLALRSFYHSTSRWRKRGSG